MQVCAPIRFATGLIKLSSTSNHPSRLLTSNDLYTNITNYEPVYEKFPTNTIYKKKHIDPTHIQSLTIKIQAGDVVTAEALTYDGDFISSPITGTIDIKFTETDWMKNIIENKDDNIKIIDLNEEKPQ